MTDYSELVKALRGMDTGDSCPCEYYMMCEDSDCVLVHAAAAIEALQAQLPKRGEIVRCGECKHRKDSIQCPLYSEGMETADDWYCADGEREVQE